MLLTINLIIFIFLIFTEYCCLECWFLVFRTPMDMVTRFIRTLWVTKADTLWTKPTGRTGSMTKSTIIPGFACSWNCCIIKSIITFFAVIFLWIILNQNEWLSYLTRIFRILYILLNIRNYVKLAFGSYISFPCFLS